MSWIVLADGGRRWGRHGAAGLLLHHDGRFLLARRSSMCHNGGTWSLPGGALHPGETPEQAAARETAEELGATPRYVVRRIHPDTEHGWTYWTVLADVAQPWVPPRLNWETADVRWVTAAEASTLPLHPGLSRQWTALTR